MSTTRPCVYYYSMTVIYSPLRIVTKMRALDPGLGVFSCDGFPPKQR